MALIASNRTAKFLLGALRNDISMSDELPFSGFGSIFFMSLIY